MDSSTEVQQRYHYIFLQTGSLPLAPDGTQDLSKEHRCSSVLIWPKWTQPSPETAILTDPCFSLKGFGEAKQKLQRLKLPLHTIKHLFITHHHADHLPEFSSKQKLFLFQRGNFSLPDLSIHPCIGHAPDLQALIFRSTHDEQIWIVGDAILDLEWLKAWGYYWPNMYSPTEIVQTWKSVVDILDHADIIIPGHGGQIFVTAPLIKELLATFPLAKHSEECPELQNILTRRLEQFVD